MAVPREPQDRKTPRAPRQRAAQDPVASEPDDAAAPLRAEAEAEETGYVEVEMGGYTYRLKPQEDWRQSTQESLRLGMVNDWAEDVMPPEDYQAWLESDPTNRELEQFFEDMGRAAGVSLGESRALRRAYSRSMRRRCSKS